MKTMLWIFAMILSVSLAGQPVNDSNVLISLLKARQLNIDSLESTLSADKTISGEVQHLSLEILHKMRQNDSLLSSELIENLLNKHKELSSEKQLLDKKLLIMGNQNETLSVEKERLSMFLGLSALLLIISAAIALILIIRYKRAAGKSRTEAAGLQKQLDEKSADIIYLRKAMNKIEKENREINDSLSDLLGRIRQ